jgi:hypothetical protein
MAEHAAALTSSLSGPTSYCRPVRRMVKGQEGISRKLLVSVAKSCSHVSRIFMLSASVLGPTSAGCCPAAAPIGGRLTLRDAVCSWPVRNIIPTAGAGQATTCGFSRPFVLVGAR